MDDGALLPGLERVEEVDEAQVAHASGEGRRGSRPDRSGPRGGHALGDELANAGHELLDEDGLLEAIVGARLACADPDLGIPVAAHEQDGNGPETVVGPERAAELEAVLGGKPGVG